MKNLLNEIKQNPIRVAMNIIIAICAIGTLSFTISTYKTNESNRKIDDMAAYLNTTPGLLKTVCTDKTEGEYLVPDEKERAAICSFDVTEMFKFTKEKQEGASSSENNVVDKDNQEENKTESTETPAE